MACIRPYRVTLTPGSDEWDPGRWLCYAVDGEWALRRTARVRFGLKRREEVLALARAGLFSAVELQAWRASVTRGPKRDWFLHAADRDAGRAVAMNALGVSAADLYLERCDDFLVLQGLSDDEVTIQCVLVWGTGTHFSSEIYSRVPTLRKRLMQDRSAPGKMTRGTRTQAVYALCTAQFMAAIGPKYRRQGRDRGEQTRERGLQREAKLLHADNVPLEIIEEMWKAGFLRDVKPFNQDQRDALSRFARAYGLNPEKVSLWQMWTLWKEGPDRVMTCRCGASSTAGGHHDERLARALQRHRHRPCCHLARLPDEQMSSGNGATKVVRGEAPEDLEAVVEEEMGKDLAPDEGRIRAHLLDIINADRSLIEDEKGEILPLRNWKPRELAAMVKISRNPKSGHTNVQFADSIKASEQLARLNGMYNQNPEQRDPFTILLESLPRPLLHEIMNKLRAVADAATPAPSDEDDVIPIDPELAIVSRETSIAATVRSAPDAAADEDLDLSDGTPRHRLMIRVEEIGWIGMPRRPAGPRGRNRDRGIPPRLLDCLQDYQP